MSSKSYECGGCCQKIKEGAVSKALDKRWHKGCFKCTDCKKPIAGSFLTKNGSPYCKPCYNKTYGLACQICKEFITGHILKYNEKAYHYGCAECMQCGKHFHDAAALSVKGGKFIHNDCKKVHSKSGMTKGDADAVKANEKEFAEEPAYNGVLTVFEQECLDAHNTLRRKHGVPDLGWSEKCAEHAREWSHHLEDMDCLAHDHSSGMGENCGYFNSSSASTKPDKVWAENVSDMWYNEKDMYDFVKNDYQAKTGHFTQMVWKNSARMGCAIAKNGNKVYIVANYYPPGNFMGKYKDNVFP